LCQAYASAEPEFVNVQGAQESIPPANVAWRADTSNRVVVPDRQAENQFLGSLKFTNSGSGETLLKSDRAITLKFCTVSERIILIIQKSPETQVSFHNSGLCMDPVIQSLGVGAGCSVSV
jgi:hypothetical protein